MVDSDSMFGRAAFGADSWDNESGPDGAPTPLPGPDPASTRLRRGAKAVPHFARPEQGVTAPPETCREYLGKALGYCDGAPQVPDMHGRGFCTDHAKERGF